MYTITEDNVREHFTAILADKGADYTYTADTTGRLGGCYYVDNSGPSCIIGQLLSRVGVPLDTIGHLDDMVKLEDEDGEEYNAGDTALSTLIDGDVLYGLGIEIQDHHLETVLILAQSLQDEGITYGAVVAEALRSLTPSA
jgi:hypothetical protein